MKKDLPEEGIVDKPRRGIDSLELRMDEYKDRCGELIRVLSKLKAEGF